MNLAPIICLSFLLILGPVAWTLEACVDGHSHQTSIEQLFTQDDHDEDTAGPSIHCLIWDQHLGAVIQSASIKVNRSSNESAVSASSPANNLATAIDNSLWLEALFKRSLDSVPSVGPARYVLLSVFRI